MSVPENGPMRREHFDVTDMELELLKGKIKNSSETFLGFP